MNRIFSQDREIGIANLCATIFSNFYTDLNKAHTGPIDKSKYVLKDVPIKGGKTAKRWVHLVTGMPLEHHHKEGDTVYFKTYDKDKGQEMHHKGVVQGHFHMSMTPAVVVQAKSELTGKVHNVEQSKVSHNPLPGSDSAPMPGANSGGSGAGIAMRLEDDEDAKELQDVNKKFETFERYVRTIAKKRMKGGLFYGTGGVGKTFTVTAQLEKLGMKEFDEDVHAIANPAPGSEDDEETDDDDMVKSKDYDYIKVSGRSTAAALYTSLYSHNGKLLVFDDCDTVIEDKEANNILKAALDTSGNGTISWGSMSSLKDEHGNALPKRFKFTGHVIFISNLPSHRVPQALKSRSLRLDLSMSPEQTIERIGYILDHVKFPGMKVTKDDKEQVLKMLDKYKHTLTDLNVRTLASLIAIKHEADDSGADWVKDAKHMIFSKSTDETDDYMEKSSDEAKENTTKTEEEDETLDIQKALTDLLTDF
jgi:hypothetical protein